jgi:poly(3-hydroxybutyrate) depolymerase
MMNLFVFACALSVFMSASNASVDLSAERSSVVVSQWQKVKFQDVDYFLYVPASRKAYGRGLVLALHGCSQQAEDLKDLGNWEEAAETFAMIVALPQVPNGGVMLGCWDYYGKAHDGNSRHSAPLIALTEHLREQKTLLIDKTRIAAAGLSSGSAQAMLLGCLRPDLFSGLGLNAGPAIGTESTELSRPQIGSKDVSRFCLDLAGKKATHFQRQKTSIIVGDHDFVVNPQHSHLISKSMQEIYDAQTRNPLDLAKLKGSNKKGQGFVLTDGSGRERVSLIENDGLGHAWPAGKENQPSLFSTRRFVNSQSINYPDYLGKFLIQEAL